MSIYITADFCEIVPCAACDRYVYNKVLCPGEWSAPISVSKLASSDVSIRKQREIHQGMMRRVSIAYKKLPHCTGL